MCSRYLRHGEPGSCSALPSFFCLLTLQLQDDSDIIFLKKKNRKTSQPENFPKLFTSKDRARIVFAFFFFPEFLFFLKILWIFFLHTSWWPYQHTQKKKKASPGIKRILMPPVFGKPFWKPSIHMQNTLQLWATEENAPRLPGVSKQPNTWKHQGQTSKRILDDTIAPGSEARKAPEACTEMHIDNHVGDMSLGALTTKSSTPPAPHHFSPFAPTCFLTRTQQRNVVVGGHRKKELLQLILVAVTAELNS